MAQTGFNSIKIYSSSTASATPSASNLTNDTGGSEIAINITDGKLFYKDNAGVVQTIATKAVAAMTPPTGTVVGTTDTQTLTNKTLTDPIITGTITEDIFALTDGATVDIDPGNGSIQTLTLAGTSRTLTYTNMVNGEAVTLMINDGTAGTITTWNVTWVNNGGSNPTLSTTAYTVIVVWKVGGVVYGALVGNV